MENIKKLFDNSLFVNDFSKKNKQQVLNFIYGTKNDTQGKIKVCTIVDCHCENQKEGHEIYEKLITVINNKENNSPPANFSYDFIKKENIARFTLFGNPDYIIKTLQLL